RVMLIGVNSRRRSGLSHLHCAESGRGSIHFEALSIDRRHRQTVELLKVSEPQSTKLAGVLMLRLEALEHHLVTLVIDVRLERPPLLDPVAGPGDAAVVLSDQRLPDGLAVAQLLGPADMVE